MSFPQTIFGDTTIWTRSVGSRPQKCLIVSDSIAVNWAPAFYGMLPQLRGMDGGMYRITGQDVSPPATLASLVSTYTSFAPRQTSGGGVLASNVSSSATTLSVTLATANTGMWTDGMLVTITDGTNTDTIAVASGQTESNFGSPTSVPLATGIAHGYTTGATVTWARPSGVGHYYWGENTEITFKSIASPSSGSWLNNRLCDWYLQQSDTGVSEDTYKQVRGWSNGPLKVTLYYLATPKAQNVNNLQLNGILAGTGTPTPVTFSAYAATPTIKAVSMTVPAPTVYSATAGPRFVAQTSGTGSFVAGDVFCPLGWYVERTDATDGYGMIFAGNGGYTIWDYANEGLYSDLPGSLHYPVAMSPAFVAQYVALAGIDTIIMQLGHNDWVDAATAQTGYRQIIANARGGNSSLRAILIDYYTTNADYNTGALVNQTAVQTVAAADPGVMGLDIAAMFFNQTYNTTFTSDGTHPSNPNGDNIVSAMILGLLASASASTTASAAASAVWSYSTSTNRTVATGTNVVTLSPSDEASIGNLSRLDAAVSSRMASGTVSVGTNLDKTGYALSSSQAFNLTGNITGNLSGSVGSVTGTVGSIASGGIVAASIAASALNGKGDWATVAGILDAPASNHATAGSIGFDIGNTNTVVNNNQGSIDTVSFAVSAIANKLYGISSLRDWLRAGFRKDDVDSTALAEINADLHGTAGTFDPAADSLQATAANGGSTIQFTDGETVSITD